MRKLILLVGAVGLLLAAPAATAKNVSVDISKVGFVPGTVTLQTGDTITFTNKDTGTHQAVCATCPFTSPVLAPGQTFVTPAFAKTGKFSVVDPLNKNKKVVVTVAAAPAAITLAATPRAVAYGAAVATAGTLSTAQANQSVDILAQLCGENAAKVIGTVKTGTNGSYTFSTQPTTNTSYTARYKPATGAAVTSTASGVAVRPALILRRLGTHRFSAKVIAAQSFVGKAVVLQRWITAKHRWSSVKTVFLGKRAPASAPLSGSTASTVTFGAKLRGGLRLRAILPSGQAAPCYAAASSTTIKS